MKENKLNSCRKLKYAGRLLLGAALLAGMTASLSAAQALSIPDYQSGTGPLLEVKEEQEVNAGIVYQKLTGTTRDGEPLVVHLLQVDPTDPLIEVSPVQAKDRVGERETVGSMVSRCYPLGAINASFHTRSGEYYLPVGGTVIERELLSFQDVLRPSVGISEAGDFWLGYFQPGLYAVLPTGEELAIDRVNFVPEGKEAVFYTPAWKGKTPGSRAERREYLLQPEGDDQWLVIDVLTEKEGIAVPEWGAVLSTTVPGGLPDVQRGTRLELSSYSPQWDSLKHLVTGGPLLVEDGRPVQQAPQEGFFGNIYERQPRTALGVNSKEELLLVVVEGRSRESGGLYFHELAYLMRDLGSFWAVNLDGGGSSSMWVDGKKATSAAERPVVNALLVWSEIRVYKNGERIYFDVPPELREDRLLVPLRSIMEALGAEVAWDGETFAASVVSEGREIILPVNSRKVLVDGEELELEVGARLVRERVLVPLRFLSETLGAAVSWDGERMRVDIYSDGERGS